MDQTCKYPNGLARACWLGAGVWHTVAVHPGGSPLIFGNTTELRSFNGSVGASGNVITLNLNGVANAQRLILEFRGVTDGVNTGNFTLQVGFLLGDTTGNGSVNGSDVSQVKLQSGQAVTGSNFRNDITVSGSINGTDVSSVKLKSGTALP